MRVARKISVVIVCRDQMASVRKAIRSLAAQDMRPDEVIIADDHSSEPMEEFARQQGCKFVCTRSHVSTVGARALARQLGLTSACGDLVIHIDGDMIPSRSTVGFSAYFQQAYGPEVVVQCPRRYRIRDGRLFQNTSTSLNIDQGRAVPSFHQFTSDCFAIHRDLALTAGGWDSNFVGWGEEDVEFAYRCQLFGAVLHTPEHPEFFACHVDHPVDHSANLLSLRRNAAYFSQKHPTLLPERRHLWADMGVYLTSYGSWWQRFFPSRRARGKLDEQTIQPGLPESPRLAETDSDSDSRLPGGLASQFVRGSVLDVSTCEQGPMISFCNDGSATSHMFAGEP